MKIFFNPQYMNVEVRQFLILKSTIPFSVTHSFSKSISTPRSGDQQKVNEHSVDYNPSPSGLTSKINSFIFL